MKKYLLQLHTPRIRTGGGRISYLLTLLLLLFASETALADVTPESNRTWTFSEEWHTASDGAIIVSQTEIKENIEIGANSSNTVSINTTNRTADGISFTKVVKLGGKGTETYRYVRFKVAANSTITVYGQSNNNNSRTLNIATGSFSNVVATQTSSSSTEVSKTSHTVGNVETEVWLYSAGSAYNILGIKVSSSSSSVVTPILSASPTNLSLTVGSTGKSTITATANGSTVSILTYSYSSSYPSVATVESDGTVTALSAGETTITVTSAAVENYNPATTTFTVTVRNSSTPSGESTRWDFTTTTAAEATSLDGTKFEKKSNQYMQSRSGQFQRYEWYTLTDGSGNEPNVLSGLQFACDAGSWGNAFRIYYAGDDNRLYFLNAFKVKVPSLVAGDKVRVTWCSSNTNTVTISGENMIASGTTTSNNTTRITTEFIVSNDGDVVFKFNNISIFY